MSDQEIELKLRVRPEDMARLRAAPLFGTAKGRAVTRQLQSVYYDTPDLRLHGRALTLRVRRQGQKFVQTLKSAPEGVGGVTTRGEWESPVAEPRPNLAALPVNGGWDQIGPLADGELRPVFESDIKRTVRRLAPGDGGEIEVAFDLGEIRTAEGQAMPVAEIELELTQGDNVKALYELALALNEVAPLRVETRTKAERGYALAMGGVTGWSKAGRLDIAPEDTVETALARIVRHCVGHLVANEACALSGDNPEGIHQMRVALRRLRSALSIFKELLPPAQYADLAAEVKWLAGAFGPARDWDVFLEELFAPVDRAFPGDPALAALAEAARRCRELGYVRAREAILSRRYTALLLRVGAWVDGRGWRDQPVSEQAAQFFQPVHTLSDRLLAKRHRQARKRGRGFAHAPPDARHELRIALKKLRYATDFFRALYPAKAVKRYADDLAHLQDALGHLQDVATVGRLMGAVEAELDGRAPDGWRQGAGMVLGWHGRGLVAMEPKLVADWDRFAATKPFWSEAKAIG